MELYLADQLPVGRWPTLLASQPHVQLPGRRDAGHARAADGRQGLGARAGRPSHAGRASPTTSSSSTRRRPATASPCCSAPRTFAQAARVGRIARQGRTIDALVSRPAHGRRVVAVAPARGDAGQRDARAAGRAARRARPRRRPGRRQRRARRSASAPPTRARSSAAPDVRRGARRSPRSRARRAPSARSSRACAAAPRGPRGARCRSSSTAARRARRGWRASWSAAL